MCSSAMRDGEKTQGLTEFTRIFSELFYLTAENPICKQGLFSYVKNSVHKSNFKSLTHCDNNFEDIYKGE